MHRVTFKLWQLVLQEKKVATTTAAAATTAKKIRVENDKTCAVKSFHNLLKTAPPKNKETHMHTLLHWAGASDEKEISRRKW